MISTIPLCFFFTLLKELSIGHQRKKSNEEMGLSYFYSSSNGFLVVGEFQQEQKV